MKILTYVLIALLVICLGGAGYYYMAIYKPLAAEYELLKNTKPQLDKANNELKKLRERENAERQQRAWVDAGVTALSAALKDLIDSGKAEVVPSGNRIVINIAETVLYTPNSVTFAKDSRPVLDTLAQALQQFKDKELFIGNLTVSAPPTGKGRKKKPGKDARTIASARSVELVKSLEKGGMPGEALIASAYPQQLPDHGFKLKDRKTVIVISVPATAGGPAPMQQAAKPAALAAPPAGQAANAAPNQQKPIPITTPPPKKIQ